MSAIWVDNRYYVYMTTDAITPPSSSQTERGLRELRSKIVAGHWPASTKLREVPLAETFGLSRTPLRAALLRLEQEGLLERAGAGYTIRAFSIADALIAIELRGVIEGTAARLAAERKTGASELACIKSVVADIDDVIHNDAIDKYAKLNDQFHDQLARLAGSDLIKTEVERASRLPFAAPSAFSSSKDDITRFKTSLIVGQQHHHALVQAIERGEGARADALAREHAHLAKTNIEVAYRDRAENNRIVPQLALVTD